MKKIKQIVIGILVAGFVIIAVKGFYNTYKTDYNTTDVVLKTLEDNCDCEDISKSMYTKGIQFSKDDGFTTEKADFKLVNCKYSNFNNEVSRIESLLQNEVENISNFNQITLDFVSNDKHETVIIKNGKIQ